MTRCPCKHYMGYLKSAETIRNRALISQKVLTLPAVQNIVCSQHSIVPSHPPPTNTHASLRSCGFQPSSVPTVSLRRSETRGNDVEAAKLRDSRDGDALHVVRRGIPTLTTIGTLRVVSGLEAENLRKISR